MLGHLAIINPIKRTGITCHLGKFWYCTIRCYLRCLLGYASEFEPESFTAANRRLALHICQGASTRQSVQSPQMQLSIVWLMVDLLQWTRVRLQYMAQSEALDSAAASASRSGPHPSGGDALQHGKALQTGSQQYNALMDGDVSDEDSSSKAVSGLATSSQDARAQLTSAAPPTAPPGSDSSAEHNAPDLHAMGKMFLGKTSRVIFDAAVMLHFLSVLVSYALAGSLAYAQLFGLKSHLTLVIPVYVAVYCVLIFFGGKAVQSIISTFTFFKVTLLLFMIGVVGIVANRIDLPIHDDWGSSMEPFLLGTVALGGVVNSMPVIFSRIPFNASAMLRFRWAVTGGVVLCWMLNLLWAYFVLEIVPQTPELGVRAGLRHPELSGLDVSLQRSREHGEISTVPVTEIINTGYPQYSWISLTVTIFIVLSVSVSFITIGTGMKHVLDGMGKLPPACDRPISHTSRCSCRAAQFPSVLAMLLPKLMLPNWLLHGKVRENQRLSLAPLPRTSRCEQARCRASSRRAMRPRKASCAAPLKGAQLMWYKFSWRMRAATATTRACWGGLTTQMCRSGLTSERRETAFSTRGPP